MDFKKIRDSFKNKKILVLGLGREGIDTLKFLRKLFPKKTIEVADRLNLENLENKIKKIIKKDKRIKCHFGKKYLKAIQSCDIVIKSPGIPAHLPEIENAYKEGKITSQTEIFLNNCPGRVIGITGTKGKGTTSTLIYKILKKGNIRVHLIGNIGKPALSLLFSATKKDVYVYELSSHQLYKIKKSPQIAVFLNIYPEHLDYYKNFREYLRAKQNITRYQEKKDYFIYNPKNKKVRETAKISKARKIPISLKEIIPFLSKVKLKGDFNLLNISAAVKVGKLFRIPSKTISRVISSFKGLPYRLEFIGKYKGISFYNDSLATIPEATIEAVKTLGKDLQTILLGGYERNIDFQKLAKEILKSKIKNLILLPTTGKKIWQEINRLSKGNRKRILRHFFVDNMEDAVETAYLNTEKGKICLLSPASSSFSGFKDYKERGDLFNYYVKKYGKK